MDGNIVFDVVDDPDKHGIIFPGIESRPRRLSIHGDNGLAST